MEREGFTWMRHGEHGGWWECPNEVLDDMAAYGWEIAEGTPPAPSDPATAEALAWRAAQQATKAAKIQLQPETEE